MMMSECVDGVCLAPTAAATAKEEEESGESTGIVASPQRSEKEEITSDGKVLPPPPSPATDNTVAVANPATSEKPEGEKDQVDKNQNSKKNNKKQPQIIQTIHSQKELDSLLTQSHHGGTIVEFMTTWCGACKSIAPLYEELASLHVNDVTCGQVVCDKNKETKKLAQAHGIGSYPVFYVYDENGSQIQKWNGADRGKLEKAFEKLASGGGGGGGGNKKKKGGGKRKNKRG